MNSQLLNSTTATPHWRARGIAERADWRLLIVALLLGDALCVIAGLYIAYAVRFWTGWDVFQISDQRPEFYSSLMIGLVPCWLAIFKLYGLYNQRYLLGGTQEYARIFNSCLLGVIAVVVVSFFAPGFVVARAWLILAWASVLILTTFWRFSVRRVVYALRRRGVLLERIVILGANAEGRAVATQLGEFPGCGAQIIGFIDEASAPGVEVIPGIPMLGPAAAFQNVIEQHRIDAVIIADSTIVRERLPNIYGAMDTLQQLDVRLSPGLFELLTTGVQVHEQGSVPLLLLNKTRITGPHAVCKLLMDRLGALAAVIALAPLFLVVAVLIKLDDGGPIFHRRRVVGAGKRPFDAFKFRTMILNADAYLASHPELHDKMMKEGKLKEDPRLTRVGRYLRRWSIDEVPQLINVLRGQMSLVGPRMLTLPELDHFGRWQHNLLTVRPGLTGLWQISGRSDVGYEERVRLDMHYIRNYSVWLDLYIIVRTLPIVINGHGAY